MLRETAAPYRAGGKRGRRKPKPQAWDFWHPPTAQQLAKEQGTKPFDIQSFRRADFWPEGEDVEEFIRAAKGERSPSLPLAPHT